MTARRIARRVDRACAVFLLVVEVPLAIHSIVFHLWSQVALTTFVVVACWGSLAVSYRLEAREREPANRM